MEVPEIRAGKDETEDAESGYKLGNDEIFLPTGGKAASYVFCSDFELASFAPTITKFPPIFGEKGKRNGRLDLTAIKKVWKQIITRMITQILLVISAINRTGKGNNF
jgi:hypothetical protein